MCLHWLEHIFLAQCVSIKTVKYQSEYRDSTHLIGSWVLCDTQRGENMLLRLWLIHFYVFNINNSISQCDIVWKQIWSRYNTSPAIRHHIELLAPSLCCALFCLLFLEHVCLVVPAREGGANFHVVCIMYVVFVTYFVRTWIVSVWHPIPWRLLIWLNL